MRVLKLFGLMLVCGCLNVAVAKISADDAAKALPREVSGLRLASDIRASEPCGSKAEAQTRAADTRCPNFASATAEYVSPDGEKFIVELVRVEQDSQAYSLLTRFVQRVHDEGQARDIQLARQIGTISFSQPGRVAFFKGTSFVIVSSSTDAEGDSESLIKLAGSLADGLPKGEGDVPILVKHLPRWETVQSSVVYVAGFRSLKELVPNQPILEAITSEGDADVVRATYGTAQFVLVEFNTPQLAGDNDRAITARLEELRQQGQPLPNSYRKVGNYSVFVFNATSEAEAKSLIDQVEYAQMVTWLGDNPYLLEKAQKDYYETTAGVLVAVVKASGLSLLACLGIGGLLGAVLFSRRRAQQRAAEAFSDAGGMLRLNLDDITPQSDSAKLLGP